MDQKLNCEQLQSTDQSGFQYLLYQVERLEGSDYAAFSAYQMKELLESIFPGGQVLELAIEQYQKFLSQKPLEIIEGENNFLASPFIVQIFDLHNQPNIIYDPNSEEEEIEPIDVMLMTREDYLQVSTFLSQLMQVQMNQADSQLRVSQQLEAIKLGHLDASSSECVKNCRFLLKIRKECLLPVELTLPPTKKKKQPPTLQIIMKIKAQESLDLYERLTSSANEHEVLDFSVGSLTSTKGAEFSFQSFFKSRSLNVATSVEWQEGTQVIFYLDFSSLIVLKVLIMASQIQTALIGDLGQLYLKLKSPPSYYVAKATSNYYCQMKKKREFQQVDNYVINHLMQHLQELHKPMASQKILYDIQHLLLLNTQCVSIRLADQSKLKLFLETMKVPTASSSLTIIDSKEPFQPFFKQFPDLELEFQTFEKLSVLSRFEMLSFISEGYFLCTSHVSQILRLFQKLEELVVNPQARYKYILRRKNLLIRLNQNANLQESAQLGELNKKLFAAPLEAKTFADVAKEDKCLGFIVVPHVSLTPSGIRYRTSFLLHSATFPNITPHNFLSITLSDENGNPPYGNAYLLQKFYPMALQQNVTLLSKQFTFYTWNTELLQQTASVWFIEDQKGLKVKLIDYQSEFCNLQLLGKAPNADALGLSMRIELSWGLSLNEVKDLDLRISSDLPRQGECAQPLRQGWISEQLRNHIARRVNLEATVFRVQYEGATGLVATSALLGQESMVLNQNMIKYHPPQNRYRNLIAIFDVNRFRQGYLNEFIFLQLKNYNVDLGYLRKSVTEQLLLEAYFGCELYGLKGRFCPNQWNRNYLKEIALQNGLKFRRQRRIPVIDSAKLFSIIDEFGVLGDGEIYCAVNYEDKTKAVTGTVLVARELCLVAADLQVAFARPLSELEARKPGTKLKYPENCIVLPAQSQSISQMAMNSNTQELLVFWDERLTQQLTNQAGRRYNQIELVQLSQESVTQGCSFEMLNKAHYEGKSKYYFEENRLLEAMWRYFETHALEIALAEYLRFANTFGQQDQRAKDLAFRCRQGAQYPLLGRPVSVSASPESGLTNQKQSSFQELLETALPIGLAISETNLKEENQLDLINLLLGADYQIDAESVEAYISRVYRKSVVKRTLECILFLFENVHGLTNSFDLKSEYDLYTGNLEKPGSIAENQLLNQLILLKREAVNIVEPSREYSLRLLHYLILTARTGRHEKIVSKIEEEQKYSKLKKQCKEWYTGCGFYFFPDLDFK